MPPLSHYDRLRKSSRSADPTLRILEDVEEPTVDEVTIEVAIHCLCHGHPRLRLSQETSVTCPVCQRTYAITEIAFDRTKSLTGHLRVQQIVVGDAFALEPPINSRPF